MISSKKDILTMITQSLKVKVNLPVSIMEKFVDQYLKWQKVEQGDMIS